MLNPTRRPGHPVRQNSYGAGDQDPMAPAAAPQPTVIIGAPGPVMQQAQAAGQPMPGSPGTQQSSVAPAPTGPDVHPMDPGTGEGPITPMHPTDPVSPQQHAGPGQDDYEPDPYSPHPYGGDFQDVYGMKHMGRGPGWRRKGPIKPPPIKPHDPIDPVPPPQAAPVNQGIAGTDTTTAGIQYGPHYQA